MAFPNASGKRVNTMHPRAGYFQVAYSSAPAMVMRTLDAGSKYPFTFRDARGGFLNGFSTCKRLYRPTRRPPHLTRTGFRAWPVVISWWCRAYMAPASVSSIKPGSRMMW